MIYVLWNNAYPQQAMGYWLKSFNADPPPVPGTSYSVSQINNLPLPSTAIFIVMALFWGWLSDGPLKGLRWPFIYAGAIIAVSLPRPDLTCIMISDSQPDGFRHRPSQDAALWQQ
jgi:hypothetical protein